jgi:hypothetical protein
MSQPKNGHATAGLVLGICGVVFCWWGITTLAMALLATIFGAVGLKRSRLAHDYKRGSAIAGLTLGIIGLIVYLILGICTAGIFLLI